MKNNVLRLGKNKKSLYKRCSGKLPKSACSSLELVFWGGCGGGLGVMCLAQRKKQKKCRFTKCERINKPFSSCMAIKCWQQILFAVTK